MPRSLLWLAVLYFVLPLWWLFVSATKDNSSLFSTFGLWFGGEGRVAGWDYNSSIGYQRTHQKEYNQGYPFGIAFNDLMASGLWNPFVLPGNQSQAALDAAAAIMTDGYYDGEKSELISVDGKISREVFSLLWSRAVAG